METREDCAKYAHAYEALLSGQDDFYKGYEEKTDGTECMICQKVTATGGGVDVSVTFLWGGPDAEAAGDNCYPLCCRLPAAPTVKPSFMPTKDPSAAPTNEPTREPSATPTNEPTKDPTNEPTDTPTNAPSSSAPTVTPAPVFACAGGEPADLRLRGLSVPDAIEHMAVILAAAAGLAGAGPCDASLVSLTDGAGKLLLDGPVCACGDPASRRRLAAAAGFSAARRLQADELVATLQVGGKDLAAALDDASSEDIEGALKATATEFLGGDIGTFALVESAKPVDDCAAQCTATRRLRKPLFGTHLGEPCDCEKYA